MPRARAIANATPFLSDATLSCWPAVCLITANRLHTSTCTFTSTALSSLSTLITVYSTNHPSPFASISVPQPSCCNQHCHLSSLPSTISPTRISST